MPGHGLLRDRIASAQLPSGGESILPRERPGCEGGLGQARAPRISSLRVCSAFAAAVGTRASGRESRAPRGLRARGRLCQAQAGHRGSGTSNSCLRRAAPSPRDGPGARGRFQGAEDPPPLPASCLRPSAHPSGHLQCQPKAQAPHGDQLPLIRDSALSHLPGCWLGTSTPGPWERAPTMQPAFRRRGPPRSWDGDSGIRGRVGTHQGAVPGQPGCCSAEPCPARPVPLFLFLSRPGHHW